MHAGLDVHTDTREQLLAEAYALRAFVHFDLVNLYAKWYDPVTASTDRGIPLALKVDVGQDFKPVSVDQVYAQIFSDLQEAGKYMQVEEQSGTKLYRFSKNRCKPCVPVFTFITGTGSLHRKLPRPFYHNVCWRICLLIR